jgi:hypothetical protein
MLKTNVHGLFLKIQTIHNRVKKENNLILSTTTANVLWLPLCTFIYNIYCVYTSKFSALK